MDKVDKHEVMVEMVAQRKDGGMPEVLRVCVVNMDRELREQVANGEEEGVGCNMGMGNPTVLQPWVPQVWVRFHNSGPETISQPITTGLWVFAVSSLF